MEHGGRLPANCALTVYYLPVYPPYCDYNYGLRCFRGRCPVSNLLDSSLYKAEKLKLTGDDHGLAQVLVRLEVFSIHMKKLKIQAQASWEPIKVLKGN
jgi:hypothetical protein